MSCGASSAAQHLMLAFAPTAPYLRILCNSECFVKGGLTSLMLATVRGTDQETTIRRPSQNAAACLCGGTIALVSSDWGQMTASTNQVQAYILLIGIHTQLLCVTRGYGCKHPGSVWIACG